MNQDIQGLIRCRMSAEEAQEIVSKFSPAQLENFNNTIKVSKQMYQDKLGLAGQRGNGENFWEVRNPKVPDNQYPVQIEGFNKEQVGVQYKEYFTFVPTSDDPNELLQEVIKFYSALLDAYAKINKIAEEKNLDIKMKFKDDLAELLRDMDSAVIYVPNPETGKLIRNIVDTEMQKRQTKTGRQGRAASGFDLKMPGKVLSHRQLIAGAIGQVMDEDYRSNRKLAGYNDQKLAESILSRTEQASKLTPEQMVRVI